MDEPSTNGSNGRDDVGRFATGNAGGPGNPFAAKVAAWRKALHDAVTDEDMRAIVGALINKAKAGEPWAVREVLDRTLGKSTQADLIERIEALEAALTEGGR